MHLDCAYQKQRVQKKSDKHRYKNVQNLLICGILVIPFVLRYILGRCVGDHVAVAKSRDMIFTGEPLFLPPSTHATPTS